MMTFVHFFQETKQSEDEKRALINDIFQRCMPDHAVGNNVNSDNDGISR